MVGDFGREVMFYQIALGMVLRKPALGTGPRAKLCLRRESYAAARQFAIDQISTIFLRLIVLALGVIALLSLRQVVEHSASV